MPDRSAPGHPRPETELGRAFARVSGAELRAGNRLRLLRDGCTNYPAWLEAIGRARRVVHFENFIVADDEAGRRFAEALAERARAGVTVRVLYDWLGCMGRAGPRFWRRLREAGVEVRVFNPPRLSSPLWIRRTHRKMITVDGEVGFVSGLCVAEHWHGGRAEPWRDTGVMIEGPAVADLDAAFSETWGLSGPPLPPADLPSAAAVAPVGDTAVRVISGRPYQLSTYRLDLLVAASAQRSLWLTDAYFVATAAYVQALAEAARDGVDVRLLVPGSSDVPFLQNLVRPGYRPLVEAGVRVFEWNGSMLHAKTAVADGRWSRIGSTNLNLTSWLTNWELDVMVEDERFAEEMEAMYLADLTRSTEVVLGPRPLARPIPKPAPAVWPRRGDARTRTRAGLARLAGSAVGLKRVAGHAIAGTRSLTRAEAKSVGRLGVTLIGLALLLTFVPALVISPVVIMLLWLAVALLMRAWRARRALAVFERRQKRLERGAEAPAEALRTGAPRS